MRMSEDMRRRAAVIACVALVAMQTGCMTVSSQRTVVENTIPSRSIANKRIAVLPVKAQTSLAPDSVIAIRTELNREIGVVLRAKMPAANLIDFTTVSNQLNERGALPAYEQLMATYENTGVFDKQRTLALANALGSDFLMVSRLKAERMDIVISRATGTSLEASLTNASTAEVVRSGSGEWKRGGVLGFGSARPDEAAKGLVSLTFSSLQVQTSPATDTSAASQPVATPSPRPAAATTPIEIPRETPRVAPTSTVDGKRSIDHVLAEPLAT